MSFLFDDWRQFFGRSKKQVWRQLAREIGATFVDGGFWARDEVRASVPPWTLTLALDISEGGTWTRLMAACVKDDFRFTLYREGLGRRLQKQVGLQDILVGDPELDHAFIVQGSNEAKVRALLADPRLRLLIRQQSTLQGFRLSVYLDAVSVQVDGVLKEIEALKSLFALAEAMLRQLCRIGSASEAEPKTPLPPVPFFPSPVSGGPSSRRVVWWGPGWILIGPGLLLVLLSLALATALPGENRGAVVYPLVPGSFSLRWGWA